MSPRSRAPGNGPRLLDTNSDRRRPARTFSHREPPMRARCPRSLWFLSPRSDKWALQLALGPQQPHGVAHRLDRVLQLGFAMRRRDDAAGVAAQIDAVDHHAEPHLVDDA